MKGIAKGAVFAAATIFLLNALVFPAAAKEIKDDCNAITPGPKVQYNNLGEASGYIAGMGVSGFPDGTALGLQNCAEEGFLLLEALQAQMVTVSIYSRDKGTYGVLNSGGCIVGSMEPGPQQELLFSAGSGRVYLPTGQGKGKEMVYHSVMAVYTFPNGEVPLPKDAVRYGLNVYASTDGAAYQPVSLRCLGAKRYQGTYGALYYETYQGNLPEGSCFLKIAVNDFSSIATNKGKFVPNNIQYPVGIASVSVTVPDDPPEMPPEPETPPKQEVPPVPTTPSGGGSIILRPPNGEKPKDSGQEKAEEEEDGGIMYSFGGNTSAPYYYGSAGNTAKGPATQSGAKAAAPQPVPEPQPFVVDTEEMNPPVPLAPAPAAEAEKKNTGPVAAAAVAGAAAALLLPALMQKGIAAYKQREKQDKPLEEEQLSK